MTQRGFTLQELMVTLALLFAIGGVVSGVGMALHQRDRTTAAYAEDLRGLRRAAAHLQQDLRAAGAPHDVDYRLENGRLLRDGRPLMRNVAVFALTHEGTLARVRLELAPRSDAPTRRRALLDFRVRMRGGSAR